MKLKPVFQFNNKDITEIFSVTVEIPTADKHIHGTGMVQFNNKNGKIFILIEISIEKDNPLIFSLWLQSIREIIVNGDHNKGYVSWHEYINNKVKFHWEPYTKYYELKIDPDTTISYIMFNFFNFTGISDWDQSFSLCHGEWIFDFVPVITLDEYREIDDKSIVHTHVCKLYKTDDRDFTIKSGKDILKDLSKFISFIRGSTCRTIGECGYDVNGYIIWKSCSSQQKWKYVDTWIFKMEDAVLLFPEFMKLLNEPCWRKPLERILYWYLISNSIANIDAAIILLQSTLELLSYEYIINKKILTKNKINSLTAKDKIKTLLGNLNIDTSIPSKAQFTLKKFNNGPEAIVEIRNDLTHPKMKYNDLKTEDYSEIYDLGIWYVQLSILAICQYSGKFIGRFNPDNLPRLVPFLKQLENG